MLLSIALRNLLRQRTRSLLTLASIALGVASIMLANGFIDDVLWQLREATIRSQLGHLQVFAPGFLDEGRREPLSHTVADAQGAVARLQTIPGVATVARRLGFSGLLSNGRSDLAVIVEGIEPAAEAQIGTALTIASGKDLVTKDRNAITVGEGVAAALRLRVGDPVTLLASTKDGALNTLDARLSGVFRSPFKDYDARAIRISLADAQEVAGVDSVNTLVVLLQPDRSVDDALVAARDLLPSARYDVRPWTDLADFYQGVEALYRRQFLVLVMIVSVMVMLGVANSITMSLHERQGEFGTVRALGYRPDDVFAQIVTESVVLGSIAAAVGIALGVLLASGISAIGIEMPPPPNSDIGYTAKIRLSLSNVLIAAATAFIASVAGSIVPARRLARMPIVDALRHAI
jgi:putative ABC transport system permease protein